MTNNFQYFRPSKPPQPEQRPVDDTRHGITRTDEYAWLRADNWQEVFQRSRRCSTRRSARISKPRTPIRRR